VIPRLPAAVRREVGNYYLLCRYLDSIEDSTLSAEQKERALSEFVRVAKEIDFAALSALSAKILPAVTAATDREMVAGFAPVLSEFGGFDPKSREIAVRWLATMASGMNEFSMRRIQTFKELDAYCYYVAGTVGHYLTDIFAYKFGWKRLDGFRKRCEDFGLFLQKTNIIRDFSRDYSEGRVFWPSELFARHGVSESDVLDGKNTEKGQLILAEMVADARRHVQPSEEYVEQIPLELLQLQQACAIPLLMAIPTLDKCAENPAVFDVKQKVKLSREETSEILRKLSSKGD
jgi:farnesyl-diphosphate farnesyltransferase